MPNNFAKKETTNDHARTETICQSCEVPAEYHNNNQSDQNRQNCLSQKLLPNSKDKPSLISVQQPNVNSCSSSHEISVVNNNNGNTKEVHQFYDDRSQIEQNSCPPLGSSNYQHIPTRITDRKHQSNSRKLNANRNYLNSQRNRYWPSVEAMTLEHRICNEITLYFHVYYKCSFVQ